MSKSKSEIEHSLQSPEHLIITDHARKMANSHRQRASLVAWEQARPRHAYLDHAAAKEAVALEYEREARAQNGSDTQRFCLVMADICHQEARGYRALATSDRPWQHEPAILRALAERLDLLAAGVES